MNTQDSSIRIPLNKTLFVLLGFPIVSYLLSILLLKRDIFSGLGLSFFPVFWCIVTFWYFIQIIIVKKILNSEGYSLSSIGYAYSKKKTVKFILGYLIFSAGLTVFIEITLRGNNVDPQQLSDFSNLTPKTTVQRIIFIIMALVGAMSEEFVYRGFAIRSLQGFKINKWLCILIAAIPFVFQHGLKSLDQFWWFFIWGLALGVLFVLLKKLYVNIVIHWLIVLSAMLAILSVIQ